METGDYVKIEFGDGGYRPGCRNGIIIETFDIDYPAVAQALVMFSNGRIVSFHKSQMKVLK